MNLSPGDKLKTLRGKKSRREVSQALGISVSALTMYELNKRTPKDDVKRKIASYYKRSIESIFF